MSSQALSPGARVLDFLLGPRIGKGAFGEIWCAMDLNTGIVWAIKTESRNCHRKTLEFEYQILTQVQSSPHFPRLGIYGRSSNFFFMSEEFLGPSLSMILKQRPSHKFSLSTAVRASYHILKCIEAFHVFGFVHRDIKPGNILTREGTENPLCLIDFGLSRVYVNPNTGQHLPARHRCGFRGTRAYASRNAHLSKDLSRRDDMISWFYLAFELMIEPLPWRGVSDKARILAMKERFEVGAKVSPIVPELYEVWRHIKGLEFADTPNYAHVYDCLMRVCRRSGFKMEDPFDWADLLHESMNDIVQTLERLKVRQVARVESVESAEITDRLLAPRITVPSPFSHLSESDECGCC